MQTNYYHTKESVDEYIRMATGFDGRELIDRLKKYLPKGSDVLEIGSGPGSDWNILREHYHVIGSDLSKEFIKRLKTEYPNEEFIELDAITLKTDKKFDGIYSNKVFQHLNDEELKISIKRQHELLNDNGIICHSFWKGEGSETYNGLLVNYQSKASLKRLFGQLFDVILIDGYKEFEEDDSIVMIARKL